MGASGSYIYFMAVKKLTLERLLPTSVAWGVVWVLTIHQVPASARFSEPDLTYLSIRLSKSFAIPQTTCAPPTTVSCKVQIK